MHEHIMMTNQEEKESIFMAPWWKRLLNGLIDYSIIWWLSVRLVDYCFRSFAFTRDFFWVQVVVLSVGLLFLGYFFIFEYFLGWTPGKYITQTRLVYRGERSVWSVLKRTALRLVPLDVVTFLGQQYPTGWHDFFSDTAVANRIADEQSFVLTKKTNTIPIWRRLVYRTVISFSLFVFVFLMVMPLIVFYRWDRVRILSVSDYEWGFSEILPGVAVAVPGTKRNTRRALVAFRLRGVQMLLVKQLSNEQTPETKLEQDMSAVSPHSMMLVRLAEYEEKTNELGDFVWYRYSLEQAPFVANGFFFRPKEADDWYQFDSQGLKIDARAVLRKIWDQLTAEQSIEL